MVRLLFISTFPPARCGIGAYTHQLVGALEDHVPENSISVLAEAVQEPTEEKNVSYCWSRNEDWVRQIRNALEGQKFDLAHLQHEEAIFGQDGRLIDLLTHLEKKNIRRVVTLHSVYPRKSLRFHRQLANRSDRIIVHQNHHQALLVSQQVPPEKIAVIPHGTPPMQSIPQDEARSRLGLPLHKILGLCFGFIHPKKGVHLVAKAFQIMDAVPNSHLVIAGMPRNRNMLDKIYAHWIFHITRRGVSQGRITLTMRFIPPEEVPLYFSAADVVLLPHQQSYGSSSGVLHAAAAAGRAILCSHSPKFFELAELCLPDFFPKSRKIQKWASALSRIFSDATLREEIAEKVSQLGKKTGWSVVAKSHLDLYQTILFRGST